MTQHHPSLEELSSYLDGQVAATQRVSLQRHLEGCPHCQREMEGLRATVALLRRVPLAEPRRRFILEPVPALRLWPWLRWATAMAAVLLAAVVSLDVLSSMGAIPLAPSPSPAARRLAEAVTPTPVAPPPPPMAEAITPAPAVPEPRPEAGMAQAPAEETQATPMATPTPAPTTPLPTAGQPPLRLLEGALLAVVALLGSLTLVLGRRRRRV